MSASTRKRLCRAGERLDERRNIEDKRKTLEGKSTIDVEKDSLVIMVQALEAIGDRCAIYAFSGHTKENVNTT